MKNGFYHCWYIINTVSWYLLFFQVLFLFYFFYLPPRSRCYFYEISQSCGSTLLETPITSPPFCFCRSRYTVRATFFFISSQIISLMYLRTRHKTVKNICFDIIVPSNPPPKALIYIMGLSLCKLSSISLNKSVSGSNCKWTFSILEIVACNREISKNRLLWTCPLKCLDNWSQVYALWLYLWGVI